jgi:hypothetical protein
VEARCGAGKVAEDRTLADVDDKALTLPDTADPLRFGDLDPVMASEVITALTELTS